jgi:hypothetical protein
MDGTMVAVPHPDYIAHADWVADELIASSV